MANITLLLLIRLLRYLIINVAGEAFPPCTVPRDKSNPGIRINQLNCELS